ncbi:uncharacterized protein LOC128932067 isoform X5 [Callithrix jacchus]|uniref:uncharacterized protein LOC128932067 n=1 Tax=Callithrix jacchus TaxID=9483 RepID=UPI0023DD6689|nr:uncharacterized protein LOC128932067 [Callithrix jacchus]
MAKRKSAEAAAALAGAGQREVSVGGGSGPGLGWPERSQRMQRWRPGPPRPGPATGTSAAGAAAALARPERSQRRWWQWPHPSEREDCRRQPARPGWREVGVGGGGCGSAVRASRGGFSVMVEDETGLCGFSGFARPAALCHEKEELSAACWRLEPGTTARLAAVGGRDGDCRAPERQSFALVTQAWSAMAQSRLTATYASWVQAILLSQPPE